MKMKNLALVDGLPLISYAITAALSSNVFDRVVLNSDSEVFENIANRYDVDFYLRPTHLGESETQSDEVVADFIEKYPCDVVAWVNPIAPFQTSMQLRQMVKKFFLEELDTLHTIKQEQVHAMFRNTPINFSDEELFARTQDLIPVGIFAYSLMMWRSSKFIASWKATRRGFFVGKTGYFDVGKMASMLIKTEEDLKLADWIMRGKKLSLAKPSSEIEYDPVVEALSFT